MSSSMTPAAPVEDLRLRDVSMPTMTRLGAVAISSALLGLVGGTLGLGPQAIAADPGLARFVNADQWGGAAPGSADWAINPVAGTTGRAQACALDLLPLRRTTQVRWTAKNGTTALQYVVEQPTTTAAAKLVQKYLSRAERCERKDVGRAGRMRVAMLSTHDVASGLTVLGAFHRVGHGTTQRAVSTLIGVGRDRRLVTVIELRVPGKRGSAPVSSFQTLSQRAVDQLN
ncbi:MAG: hypothetical protein ACT4P1_02050 [Sporichthyaceae bacterium]